MCKKWVERWYDTYNEHWMIYDRFSACEDYEDSAFKALQKYISFAGKTVYEIGCGTGKYTAKIAGLCDKLYANDISPLMIEKAKEKCAGKANVEFITASAENSGLADESVDIIFSAWGNPPGKEVTERTENEFSRILKRDGAVWIFTNYLRGEFTQMRGFGNPSDPTAFFTNGMAKYGYKLVEVVPAYWQFADLDEAKHICGFIFGKRAVKFFKKKGCPVMEDNIAIFSHGKV